MFPIGCFALFRDLKTKWKQDSGPDYGNDKAKIQVKKCEQGRITSRCQAYKNAFACNPLLLFEATSTEGPPT